MTDSTHTRLEPGPDHPITIQGPETGHVTVRLAEKRFIAETDRALALRGGQPSRVPLHPPRRRRSADS